jgi:hypothetical protein
MKLMPTQVVANPVVVRLIGLWMTPIDRQLLPELESLGISPGSTLADFCRVNFQGNVNPTWPVVRAEVLKMSEKMGPLLTGQPGFPESALKLLNDGRRALAAAAPDEDSSMGALVMLVEASQLLHVCVHRLGTQTSDPFHTNIERFCLVVAKAAFYQMIMWQGAIAEQ